MWTKREDKKMKSKLSIIISLFFLSTLLLILALSVVTTPSIAEEGSEKAVFYVQ
jgi:hypothetical protein